MILVNLLSLTASIHCSYVIYTHGKIQSYAVCTIKLLLTQRVKKKKKVVFLSVLLPNCVRSELSSGVNGPALEIYIIIIIIICNRTSLLAPWGPRATRKRN